MVFGEKNNSILRASEWGNSDNCLFSLNIQEDISGTVLKSGLSVRQC